MLKIIIEFSIKGDKKKELFDFLRNFDLLNINTFILLDQSTKNIRLVRE